MGPMSRLDRGVTEYGHLTLTTLHPQSLPAIAINTSIACQSMEHATHTLSSCQSREPFRSLRLRPRLSISGYPSEGGGLPRLDKVVNLIRANLTGRKNRVDS